MNTDLKIKILELRSKGLSYNEIRSKLNCSKGTISYYCNPEVKKSCYLRNKKRRSNNPLISKVNSFIRKSKNLNKLNSNKLRCIKEILHAKIRTFTYSRRKEQTIMFTVDELLNKIGDNPKCYLTGRSIDLSKSRSYHLDHILPASKDGDNSLNNCGLTCKQANQAKSDMTLDEFKQLCSDVIQNLSAEDEIRTRMH